MGPQMAMQFQSPEGIKRVVHEMVNQELLYSDAITEGMDNEDAFQGVLQATKVNLLKGYAFNKIIEDIKVEESELKSFYEENKAMFSQQESIQASHILVEEKDKAEMVLSKLNEGLSFEEAAKEYSTCPSKEAGGSLGEFGRGQMVPEFEEAAFIMEEGAISEPIKTQFGYHIIRLDKKNENKEPTFEEVKEEVQRQLLAKKQENKYTAKIDSLKEKYPVEIY
jgi:peptidyl-prolyl cis-trans isomerase C